MTSTITLRAADGGTDIIAVHDGIPPGVAPADNELGWRLSLAKLAKLVEGGWPQRRAIARTVAGRSCA